MVDTRYYLDFACPNCGGEDKAASDVPIFWCRYCRKQLMIGNGGLGVLTQEQADEAPKYFKGETRTSNSGECNCHE